MPSLSASAKDKIQAILDNATSVSSGVAGLAFCAIDKSGQYLTQNYSGHRSHAAAAANKDSVDQDTVFWIASCTKMITGIACMQLVEQGKLELDNPELVYRLCPELKEKKVLKSDGTLEPRRNDITLRMLLDHTAGFGYTFFNEKLRDFARPAGLDELAGDTEDLMEMPLVNQPGEVWEYGINIDWAGILVERASGLKLGDYFQQNIFKPLGIENISFAPNKHMRDNLVTMTQRDVNGKGSDVDHLARRAISQSVRPGKDFMHYGGAGCFAKPREYCQILATLLNNGTSPTTNARILSEDSIKTMFTNSIPQFPDFGRQGTPAAKPELTSPLPEMYPQAGNPPQGWGVTFMITHEEGATGRGRDTVWWAGLANLFWWVDRENGVAGMIAGQVLPFGDAKIMGAWAGVESAIYEDLKVKAKV